MDLLRLFQKGIRRYRSDGLVPLFHSTKLHLPFYFRRFLFGGEMRQDAIIKSRYLFQKIRFHSPAYPFDTIQVNPNDILKYNDTIQVEYGVGQIREGEWDRRENQQQLKNHWIVKGLQQRFEEKKDWEETRYYEKAKSDFEKGFNRWDYQNITEFREVRCTFVDELYKSIRDNGYRPNFKAGHNVPEGDSKGSRSSWKHRLEPLVVIGRNGEIYWRDGYHRYTIARILELDSIPVQVLARHQEWQKKRDKVAQADTVSSLNCNLTKYADHPDLHMVISN